MILGGTAAEGATRLDLLREAADTDDPMQRKMVVNALNAGVETIHFGRVIGPESSGSRPSLESWRPATDHEATEYVAGCVRLLCEMALEHDMAGEHARAKLGASLYTLTLSGHIDVVEEAVHRVVQQGIIGREHCTVFAMRSAITLTLSGRVRSTGSTTSSPRLDPRLWQRVFIPW